MRDAEIYFGGHVEKLARLTLYLQYISLQTQF